MVTINFNFRLVLPALPSRKTRSNRVRRSGSGLLASIFGMRRVAEVAR